MNPAISAFDPLTLLPDSDLSVLSDEQKNKLARDVKNKLGEFLIISFSDELVQSQLDDILDTVGMERQMKKLEGYLPTFSTKAASVIGDFKIKFQENYNQ